MFFILFFYVQCYLCQPYFLVHFMQFTSFFMFKAKLTLQIYGYYNMMLYPFYHFFYSNSKKPHNHLYTNILKTHLISISKYDSLPDSLSIINKSHTFAYAVFTRIHII